MVIIDSKLLSLSELVASLFGFIFALAIVIVSGGKPWFVVTRHTSPCLSSHEVDAVQLFVFW